MAAKKSQSASKNATSGKKTTAATKSAAKKSSAKTAATKKSAAKVNGGGKGTAKNRVAKKTSGATKPSKAANQSTGTSKKSGAGKTAGAKVSEPKRQAKRNAAPKSDSAAKKVSAKSAPSPTTAKQPPPKPKGTRVTASSISSERVAIPKPRFSKDGMGYTKDFPLSFIKQAYEDLQAERIRLTGQANRLEQEAHQLVEDSEMGDVQFDDEGGEGDTLAVEREQDLTLSAQARETVREIDDALARIQAGTYGYSTVSGQPIPIERLEAIPWSSVLVEEKVGGIGRR